MNILRTIAFTALLVTGMALAPHESAASSSTGFFLGFSNYHRAYYPYHRPFYRPDDDKTLLWGFLQSLLLRFWIRLMVTASPVRTTGMLILAKFAQK